MAREGQGYIRASGTTRWWWFSSSSCRIVHLNWMSFSWSFFPTRKTKVLNVVSFRNKGTKMMRWIYEYQIHMKVSYFYVTLSGLLKCITDKSCRGVRPPYKKPGYDTKQSDGEVPVMLELRGMRSTPSLPSLPGPLLPGVLALDKSLIYGLNRTKPRLLEFTVFLYLNCLFMLNWIV